MDSNQSRRESAGQILKLCLLISVVAVFIVLILKDIVKALKKRAHWIPGDFLVLSAFTIQLLNLLSSQGEPLDPNPGDAIGWGEFWMIHTSRVMLCVIVAYLMPGMANPGSEESWGKLMALVLTIFLHVSSEYYIVHRHDKVAANKPKSYYCSVWLCLPEKEINEPLYIAFASLICLCFVMLIFLLGCANIAGRGIERIVAQKIPLVLKDQRDLYSEIGEKGTEAHHHRHYHHYHHSCCQTVVKAVLRAKNREKDLPHDHSCWQTVKDLVQTANMEDEECQQTCWRIVEDVVQRAEREKVEELYKHSCLRRVNDALLRAEKVEEEHHHSHCQYCWRSVEDAVLKAWIVARAYSLEYIIARSPLAAAAASIVTIQIVITIVGGVLISPKLKIETIYGWLRFTATVLQCVFISIGWFMIEWRWATAVAYHRRWKPDDTWHSYFRLEDFWTRHLRELQQAQEPRLEQAELLDIKIRGIVAKEKTTFTVPRRLLYLVIGLQWVTVAFSKACWLVSLMIFHNKVMGKFLSFILSKHDMHAFEDYSKYEETLTDVQMLKRSPQSLWVANRKSITKAKKLILQGNEDGEYMCENLVEFLANKPQTESKYLCKMRSIQRTQERQEARDLEKQQPQEEDMGSLTVEEHFTDVGTKSWKMTAVSLLSIIVHLSSSYGESDKKHCSVSHVSPPNHVKDCLKAYSQAWEIIDFVEETDTESDGITSQAADRYFDTLQRKVKNGCLRDSNSRPATSLHALEDLKRECKGKTEPLRLEGNDSLDWKAAAYGNAVYNLCNSIQYNEGTDVNELLKELECSLANIINECLEKVQYLLLLNSKKWARNSDEKRIGKALYTAGKARLIMKQLDMRGKTIVEEKNDLAIVPV